MRVKKSSQYFVSLETIFFLRIYKMVNITKETYENNMAILQATGLIFIFMNINLQQKLMNQVIMIEIVTMKYKDSEHQRENLIVYLLELILMLQTLTFLEKHTKYTDKLKYHLRNLSQTIFQKRCQNQNLGQIIQ